MAQRLGIFLAEVLEEMRQQKRNIFAPFAKRRKAKMNDVQPMIKIFAEAAFLDEGKKIDVRSSDDAHIHFELLGAAEAHEFAFLDDAQKLGLRFRD